MPGSNPDTVATSAVNIRWILGIDTSTEQAGLAVSDGQTDVVRSWCAGRMQTTSVLPAIDELLQKARITVRDIDAIGVAIGPGTFTGLRVGLSLAKGFVLAREIPLIGIPTLDIAAAGIESAADAIAVLPAGRGRVVWQRYRSAKSSESARNTTVPELIEALAGMPAALVTGELGEEHRTLIEQAHAHVRWQHRNPAVLVDLARQRLGQGPPDDPVTLEPTYLHGVTVQAGPVQDRLRRTR